MLKISLWQRENFRLVDVFREFDRSGKGSVSKEDISNLLKPFFDDKANL